MRLIKMSPENKEKRSKWATRIHRAIMTAMGAAVLWLIKTQIVPMLILIGSTVIDMYKDFKTFKKEYVEHVKADSLEAAELGKRIDDIQKGDTLLSQEVQFYYKQTQDNTDAIRFQNETIEMLRQQKERRGTE